MSLRFKNDWEGFLPGHAVVMGSSKLSSRIHSVASSIFTSDSLDRTGAELQGGVRCKLCGAQPTVIVGEGNPQAELVFVGEGPGDTNAGQLLEKMIEAMGLSRDQVYLVNVTKCRSPENRLSPADEVATCSSFLFRHPNVLRPKVIVALGETAAQTLLRTEDGISSLRGRFHSFKIHANILQSEATPIAASTQLMPTFHPAYLLQNPEAKREVWEDLKKVAQQLGLNIPVRRTTRH